LIYCIVVFCLTAGESKFETLLVSLTFARHLEGFF